MATEIKPIFGSSEEEKRRLLERAHESDPEAMRFSVEARPKSAQIEADSQTPETQANVATILPVGREIPEAVLPSQQDSHNTKRFSSFLQYLQGDKPLVDSKGNPIVDMASFMDRVNNPEAGDLDLDNRKN